MSERRAKPVACIVDGYSSGSLFRPYLADQGYDVIHIQSREDMPALYGSRIGSEYEANVIFEDDLESLVEKLRPYDIRLILAGTDSGVVLAATLCEKFTLPTNGSSQSRLHRNKFDVNETLRSAGVDVAEQCLTEDWKVAEAWALRRGTWPVVVKPVSGSATHSVWIAHTISELRRAFTAIREGLDVFRNQNPKVLLQEFLKGTEYFVDTVSCDGVHSVTDVFRYSKRESYSIDSRADIYDYDELLDPETKETQQLIEYALRVLDGVGFRSGAAHIEIMKTERGPVLVELNPRIVGSYLPKLVKAATDGDPVALTVRASLGSLQGPSKIYRMNKQARFVNLNSCNHGVVRSCRFANAIKHLPSCLELKVAEPGSVLSPTEDLTTVAGFVFLSHSDASLVQLDYHQIRMWESQGLFELESVSSQTA